MKRIDYVSNLSPYSLLDGIKHTEENYMLEQHDKEVLLDIIRETENANQIIVGLEDLLHATAANYFCRGVKLGASLSIYINPESHNPEEE